MTASRRQDLIDQLTSTRAVAVLRANGASSATAAARAILAGGVRAIEVTMTVPDAYGVMRQLAEAEDGSLILGAGTVLTAEEVDACVEAGARFIVSPGFDPKVVDWCLEHSIAVTPGVATPTEINLALDKGLHILKFFPAQALGGVATLKAIGAPYGGVKFIL